MSVTTIDPSTGRPLDTLRRDDTRAIGLPARRGPVGIPRLASAVAESAWRGFGPTGRRASKPQGRAGHAGHPGNGQTAGGEPRRGREVRIRCEWYADHAPRLLEPEVVETEALRSQVVPQPLGVLFAIMPWNFPYWQVVRALAPALAAGNVVLLKHAPSTTGCGLALADVARSAGLPNAVLSVLVVGMERTAEVSATVIADDRVAAVTLTGSTRAGDPWQPLPAARSRRRSWSSVAAIPSWCFPMPISMLRQPGRRAADSRTPVSPVLPQSESWSRSRLPKSSSASCLIGWASCDSANRPSPA